jgi:hypothetical protein
LRYAYLLALAGTPERARSPDIVWAPNRLLRKFG